MGNKIFEDSYGGEILMERYTLFTSIKSLIYALLVLSIGIIACGSESAAIKVAQETTVVSTPSNGEVQGEDAIVRTTTKPAINTSTPEFTSTPSPIGSAIVIADSCNLRSGPGTSFGIIGNVKRDTVLAVHGKNPSGDWILISVEEKSWISTSLVKLDVDINSIPIVDIGQPEAAATPVIKAEDILPSPTQQETISGTPIPTPLYKHDQIEVFNVSTYKTSDGGLYFYGEVKNTGELPLKQIKITITLYDSESNILDFDDSYAYLPWQHNLWNTGILYPNQQAPFKIIFDNPGRWETFDTSVEFNNASDRDFAKHYKDFEIRNDTGRGINDFLYNYQITGEAVNIGDLISGNIWFIATLYDSSGKVVGADEFLTDIDHLSPDETIVFKVQVYARGPVSSYSLIYDAIKK